MCVPCGNNTVHVSDTDVRLGRMESPCNIACCGARMLQNAHLANIKLMRVTRGMRLCSTLFKYFFCAALVGAIVGLALTKQPQNTKIGAGVGAGAGLFVVLALFWFFTRKAFYTYALGGHEADPFKTLAAGVEGIKVQHLNLEAAVETAWQAWARFRGASGWWRPVTGSTGITTSNAEGHLSTLSHRQCLIPCGSDTLSLLHQRHVLIRKSAGCCNLDLCAGATWEGFWRCAEGHLGCLLAPTPLPLSPLINTALCPPPPPPPPLPSRSDDIHWVQYRRGNRTLRAFLSCFVVAIAIYLLMRFAINGQQQDDGNGINAAVSAAVGIVMLALWYFSAKIFLTFGVTEQEQPSVQVPLLSGTSLFDATSASLARRPVDLATNVLTVPGLLSSGGVITGKSPTGELVELRITPDITEVRTFNSQGPLQKALCFLCTDESTYRTKTRDLQFVYSSIESLVAAIYTSIAVSIVGIAVSIVLCENLYTSADKIQENTTTGCAITLAVAALSLLYSYCNRKSSIILGTPLQRMQSPHEKLLDAMGWLPTGRWMFHLEIRGLSLAPESVVEQVSSAVRSARESTLPVLPPLAHPNKGGTLAAIQEQQQPQQPNPLLYAAAAAGAAKGVTWEKIEEGGQIWYESSDGEVVWDLPPGAVVMGGGMGGHPHPHHHPSGPHTPSAASAPHSGPSAVAGGVTWEKIEEGGQIWYESSDGEVVWDLPPGAVMARV
jgi:hypothetical protein